MPNLPAQLLPVDVADLLIALGVGAGLSAILAFQYVKFGRTLSNRSTLAYTIPILTLTIILIISVVKSSIALSLGLVGALSIVRFRTPIKEPEELAYLFIAIAIGLGLGAGQTWPTAAATAVILLLATGRGLISSRDKKRNMYLNIDVREANPSGAIHWRRISELLEPHVRNADLRRLDVGDDFVQATLYVRCDNDEALTQAVETLKGALPDSTTITFVSQDNASGI